MRILFDGSNAGVTPEDVALSPGPSRVARRDGFGSFGRRDDFGCGDLVGERRLVG